MTEGRENDLDAERAARSATEESLRAALDECRQHHADTLAANERGQHRSATEGPTDEQIIAFAKALFEEIPESLWAAGTVSDVKQGWHEHVLAVARSVGLPWYGAATEGRRSVTVGVWVTRQTLATALNKVQAEFVPGMDSEKTVVAKLFTALRLAALSRRSLRARGTGTARPVRRQDRRRPG